MLLEILTCLTILKDNIEYGSPRMISSYHFAIDNQTPNNTLLVANSKNVFECKSSLPFNQNLTLSLNPSISDLGSKLTFLYSQKPKQELAQKKSQQIYKPSATLLFKHEQIHQINPFIKTDFPIAYLVCKNISANSDSALQAFKKTTEAEIKDVLADWSESMDAEDYGYDKKSVQREADKLKLTQKMRSDLDTCQKSTDLKLAVLDTAGPMDRYIDSKKPASSAQKSSAQSSHTSQPKGQKQTGQSTKSLVPTGQ